MRGDLQFLAVPVGLFGALCVGVVCHYVRCRFVSVPVVVSASVNGHVFSAVTGACLVARSPVFVTNFGPYGETVSQAGVTSAVFHP